ncbi:MAG: hypothetical protein JSU70_07900 [Phycisphaerales bacterium]|nr:MAG: hypothetical protein JSU70_07900 [Phycisphaerales bacterium]
MSDLKADLARSKSGDLVFAGDTYSTNLPVSQGSFQEDYHGAGDAYVVRFSPSRLPPGDVRDDDVVNCFDVSAMADMWLALVNPDADLTGDKRTDLRDYSVIAKNWRRYYIPSGPSRQERRLAQHQTAMRTQDPDSAAYHWCSDGST